MSSTKDGLTRSSGALPPSVRGCTRVHTHACDRPRAPRACACSFWRSHRRDFKRPRPLPGAPIVGQVNMPALWFLISSHCRSYPPPLPPPFRPVHLRLPRPPPPCCALALLLRKKGTKEFKYRWNDSFRGENLGGTARKSIVGDYNRAG